MDMHTVYAQYFDSILCKVIKSIFETLRTDARSVDCAKNEVFHEGFLQ